MSGTEHIIPAEDEFLELTQRGPDGMVMINMLVANAEAVGRALTNIGDFVTAGEKRQAIQLWTRLIGAANTIAGEVLEPFQPATRPATIRAFPSQERET